MDESKLVWQIIDYSRQNDPDYYPFAWNKVLLLGPSGVSDDIWNHSWSGRSFDDALFWMPCPEITSDLWLKPKIIERFSPETMLDPDQILLIAYAQGLHDAVTDAYYDPTYKVWQTGNGLEIPREFVIGGFTVSNKVPTVSHQTILPLKELHSPIWA